MINVTKLIYLGYVFEESRFNFMTQPDGSIAPYTTLSYANGLGMRALKNLGLHFKIH